MFLRNFWYAAAWPSEVNEQPISRTICGEPVVLFRGSDSKVAALEDRCCHRNLPLSMGTVEGERLRCGYHGLLFDRTGICVEVPGQANIPPGAQVRSYPLVERWKLLWIWMGDPKLADPSAIPNWFYLDDANWVAAHGNDEHPLAMKCNWQLNNDNLLDLSHSPYVHAKHLGPSSPGDFPVRTRRQSRSVSMERFLIDQQPIPLFQKHVGGEGNIDRWTGAEVTAPSHCVVDIGFAPTGKYKPGAVRDGAIGLRGLLTATPETETTSLLFYAQCRNFLLDNHEVTQSFVRDFRDLFLEDVAVMEAQQRVNTASPAAPKIDVNVDAPGIAMRTLVLTLAQEEASRRAAAE